MNTIAFDKNTRAAFRTYCEAIEWAFKYGKENCLPCHKWQVEQLDRDLYAVAIRYRASNQLVGYAD